MPDMQNQKPNSLDDKKGDVKQEKQGQGQPQQPMPAPLWKTPDATMAEELSAVKQKRILYVDDDACLRRISTKCFSGLGYSVSTAASAEEALAIFEREHFNLIVTDFDMGAGMNGQQLAAETKARKPNVPVIIVSGNDGNEDLCKDIDAFLLKPFPMAALTSLAKKLIEESEKRNEEESRKESSESG